MKKTIIIIIALAAVLAAAFLGYKALYSGADSVLPVESASNETAQAFAPSPDFSIINYAGETQKLSDHYGKPIMIVFWATWCTYCKDELPLIEAAYKKYGDQIDFMLIDLTNGRDTEEIVRAFMAKNEFTFPVYFDTTLTAAKSFGFTRIPASVLIDENGNIIEKQPGPMGDVLLNSHITKLLK